MKTASIYLKDNMIRIVTEAQTTAGLYIAYLPVFFLKDADSQEEIGLTILKALDGFKVGIPHPKNQQEFKIHDMQFNEAMKIKSWRTFMKDSKLLSLKMNEGKIIIIPYKNSGPKEGFDELEHKSRTCRPVPEELGRVILEMFEECE
jgi:hypothetical protein